MTQLATALERRIPLDAIRNFRDLGGYETRDGASVRWRTVFRTSTLAEATPGDVERLLDLNLGLVLDLRSEEEIASNGISPLHRHGVEHRHAPYRRHLRRDGEGVTGAFLRDHAGRGLDYLRGIEDALPAIRSVFVAIAEAEPGQAVVFNCEGGRDRTGVTAGLLLRTLGVPDETIVEDYALTMEYITGWRDITDPELAEMSAKRGFEITRDMLETRPETMDALLRGIDEYYGCTAELLAVGCIDEALTERLRERLLER